MEEGTIIKSVDVLRNWVQVLHEDDRTKVNEHIEFVKRFLPMDSDLIYMEDGLYKFKAFDKLEIYTYRNTFWILDYDGRPFILEIAKYTDWRIRIQPRSNLPPICKEILKDIPDAHTDPIHSCIRGYYIECRSCGKYYDPECGEECENIME